MKRLLITLLACSATAVSAGHLPQGPPKVQEEQPVLSRPVVQASYVELMHHYPIETFWDVPTHQTLQSPYHSRIMRTSAIPDEYMKQPAYQSRRGLADLYGALDETGLRAGRRRRGIAPVPSGFSRIDPANFVYYFGGLQRHARGRYGLPMASGFVGAAALGDPGIPYYRGSDSPKTTHAVPKAEVTPEPVSASLMGLALLAVVAVREMAKKRQLKQVEG